MSKKMGKTNGIKWIELIRVRSSVEALQEAMPALMAQIKEIEISASTAETFFMQHALYEGDLAVVIVWHTDVPPHKTREGLMVAQRLQERGSIDHAVWVPANPKEAN